METKVFHFESLGDEESPRVEAHRDGAGDWAGRCFMCSFEMLIDEVKGIGKCWRCGKDRKLRHPVKEEDRQEGKELLPKSKVKVSEINEPLKAKASKAGRKSNEDSGIIVEPTVQETTIVDNSESPAVEAEQEPKEEIKEEIPEPEQPKEIRLCPQHLDDLKRSGWNDDTIRESGVYSVRPGDISKIFNHPKVESMLAFPYPGTDHVRYKLFSSEPILDRDGHQIKYYQPKGS